MKTGDKVRFVLNDALIEAAPANHCRTLLEFIREEQSLCGTKEGCAEGDCGACTVAVGEPDGNGGMTYAALNACILFLPALHGKHVITVEHLTKMFGGMHPVQHAMVEHHASQCGFCTPGIVMSLFTLWANRAEGENTSRLEIESALAGNLCRCTGYRPIVDAAAESIPQPGRDKLAEAGTRAASLLQDCAGEALMLQSEKSFFAMPTSVDEVSRIFREHPSAVILSGGTDVGLWVTKMHKKLPEIICINRVKELKQIAESDDCIELGAAVTFNASQPYLEKLSPAFNELIERIGSKQIRNSGTVAANIANASPIGDMPPPLLVLDSKLKLRRGEEIRTLPLKDFFIKYRKTSLQEGEWLESVIVPKSKDSEKLRVYKISKRFDQDISSVCGAILIVAEGGVIKDARIAFGGMAEIPKRAYETEEFLKGKPVAALLDPALGEKLSSEFSPISDMRSSAQYRMTVARNLLVKYYYEVFENLLNPIQRTSTELIKST